MSAPPDKNSIEAVTSQNLTLAETADLKRGCDMKVEGLYLRAVAFVNRKTVAIVDGLGVRQTTWQVKFKDGSGVIVDESYEGEKKGCSKK